jgi:competence protein ComEA
VRLAIALGLMVCIGLVCAPAADQKDASRLPDGEGKEIAGRVCLECHDSGNFRKTRFTSDEWSDSVADMVERGAKMTAAELDTVVAYLTKNFGKDAPVRINTAPFAEIRVVLGFSLPDTRAIVDYREKNGSFKDFQDLLKVPGIDAAKAEAQKPRLVFEP